MTSLEDWKVDEVYELVRRAASYASLPRAAFDATLDLLSGRYPSDEFAELRPRIVWDRVAETLTGRPGAQRLAVTSGGTIPDRGMFGVFLVGEKASRVGELDEEMVYESRVGDVFALGATSWRIEDITHDRVLVSPAPGQPGRLPFWKGDQLGRPAELGEAIGVFTRELGALDRADAVARCRDAGLDAWAAENLVTFLDEQRAGDLACCPSDRTLLVERFRDELGDWRLVLHSPYGAQVHAPVGAGDRAAPAPSGTASTPRRWPPTTASSCASPRATRTRRGADVVVFDADEIEDLVTAEVGGSALFACRFRECAARALLLPRRDPGRRSPLWQQRQKSAQLLVGRLEVPVLPDRARGGARVPPGRVRRARAGRPDEAAVRRARSRSPRSHTDQPSPFARSLLFGYVAAVHVRGRQPAGRAPRGGTVPRPGPAGRAARACRAARAARPGGAGRGRARAAAARPRAPGPRPRGRGRPGPPHRSAEHRRGRRPGARRVGRGGRGLAARRWPRPGASSRCGSPASRAGPRSRTSPGCATGSACRCRPAPRTRSSTRSPTRWPTWSAATRACHGPFTVADVAERLGLGAAVVRQTLLRLAGSGRRASRASSARPGAARSGATPRCCAGCGAAAWPRCARRSSRSSRPPSGASCRRGRTSSSTSPRSRRASATAAPRGSPALASLRAARRRRRAVGGRAARRLRRAGQRAGDAGAAEPGRGLQPAPTSTSSPRPAR